jgi:CDGSH-type Zn-finger protein
MSKRGKLIGGAPAANLRNSLFVMARTRRRIVPLAWTAEKTGKSFFCGCKQSKTEPLCDGTHAKR